MKFEKSKKIAYIQRSLQQEIEKQIKSKQTQACEF